MSVNTYKVSHHVDLFLVFPFKLESDFILSSTEDRMNIFEKWVEKLNTEDSMFNWEIKQFDPFNSAPFTAPSFIRKRKTIYLYGEVKSTEYIFQIIKSSVSKLEKINVIGVKESVWYYDWGLGAVDVMITLEINDKKLLTKLLDIAEDIDNALRENDSIALFRHWAIYNHDLVQSFSQLLSEKTPILHKDLLAKIDISGRLEGYGINLLLQTGKSKSFNINPSALEEIMFSFSAQDASRGIFVKIPGLIASAEGYDGQAAIINTTHPNNIYIKERIFWNWRFAILYWSIISKLDGYLSNRMGTILATQYYNYKSIQEELILHNKEQLQFQLLLNEASVSNFCDDALDLRIYKGIWEAWGSDKIIVSLREQLFLIENHSSKVVDLITARHQQKMDTILFVLNIVAIASVFASLIQLYDIKNDVINPNIRLISVIFTTSLLWIILFLFIRRRTYNFHRRK